MSDILIVFATVEGHSRRVAEHVCDHVARLCHGARMVDAAHVPADLKLDRYEGAILVAPVHTGRHHQAAEHFARAHAGWLQSRPSAFISVSLSAAELEPGDMEQCRSYVDLFAADTGWLPDAVHYAAGALRFIRYDYFKRWIMRRIARQKGLPPAQAEGDEIEFTDWRALEMFVEQFVKSRLDVAAKPEAMEKV